jgi:hypothetical protein
MALIGTHRIGLRDLPPRLPAAPVALPVAIEFDESSLTHEKRFGTDTWLLAVGDAFDQLLRDASSHAAPIPGARLEVHDLEVVEFRKGLFQWSRHSVRVRFRYDLQRDGAPVASGVVEADGAGSGTEFGALTFVPVLGNLNFDKGIELAMSRCLRNAIASLAKRVEAASK